MKKAIKLITVAAMCIAVFAINGCKEKTDEEIAREALTKAGKELVARAEKKAMAEKKALEELQKNIELNGKKISVALMQANMERSVMGGSSLFPVSGKSVEADADIAERSFTSSQDYFNALIDGGYVKNELGAFYVSGKKEGPLTADNVGWSIALDIEECSPESTPLLISRNLPCDQLLSSWDGTTDASKKISVSGMVYIITRGGASIKLKPSECTIGNIYKQAFSASDVSTTGKVKYLTASGVVEAKR